MHHQAGRLGPVREGLEPAREKLVVELRRLFDQLSTSVRTYAARQGISPSLVTRYLKGDVMPPQEFCKDLADEANQHRTAGVEALDATEFDTLYRAAQDAQPRGWGNATRLRREAATALRLARESKRDLQLMAEQLAEAHNRVAWLEQECEALRGRSSRTRPQAPRPYWDTYRITYLEKQMDSKTFVTSVDNSTEEIVNHLADPRSDIPSRTQGRVLIPTQSGKSTYVTALAAKSLDAGYRLLIVLSDPLNAMRRQLQARMDESLAHAPADKNPALKLTAIDSDYRSVAAMLHVLEFEKKFPHLPLNDAQNLGETTARILVVKKNASILSRVISDIQKMRTPLREVPALILDTAGGQFAREGKVEKLMNRLHDLLPRSQYVTFEDMSPADAESRPDFMMWVPAST